MASSFSPQERLLIKDKLYEAARQYASIVGIRRTTVDQLAEAADISKGMFYKLYPSKEMLFLEMLEDTHSTAFARAEEILRATVGECDCARMKKAVRAACDVMDASGMTEIIERDISYLLRKLPEDICSTRYHDIPVHIRSLLRDNAIVPVVSMDIAAAAIGSVFLMIPHRQEIGCHYDTVLDDWIDGVCRNSFRR